jgi:hypothetical protein
MPVSLVGATLEELPAQTETGAAECEYDLLPWLTYGQAVTSGGWRAQLARATGRGRGSRLVGSAQTVDAGPGTSGHVVYGPYVALAPGCYEAVFDLRFGAARGRKPIRNASVALEVARDRGTVFLAHRYIEPDSTGISRHVLPFEVEAAGDKASDIEFRVWSGGTLAFSVIGVSARRVDRFQSSAEAAARVTVA